MLNVNKLLVADTSLYLANITANMLRGVGARSVAVVTDSAAVLAMLHKEGFDALIIDDRLHPIDGVDLTRQIRALESGYRLIPVIMVFAEASRERIIAARDAGVTEFIKKPMSPKILESRITQALENPRAFVEAPAYVGPDRRRKVAPVSGEERRQQEAAATPTPPAAKSAV